MMRSRLSAMLFSCLLTASPLIAAAQPTTLHTLQGQTFALDKFKGKWLLIHYWASWCDACTSEIHTLNTFYRQNKPHMALFAVNLDDVSLAEQKKLSQRYRLAFPSLSQGHTAPFNGDDITALPAMMVFDPEGHFQGVHYGMQSLQALQSFIKTRESL